MAKSKFFRVFVEGNTISDGRKITADMIDQIVATFNPATYTPNINCEHIKGYSPEPPFNCYGTVAAVRAQDDDIVIDGKTTKKKALYAQLDPNAQLLAINKAGQKKFTSVELTPSYGGTGKVGLVGLAVTDTPASLGTEALTFSALKPMWDARKADPANLFTAADPDGFLLELEPDDGKGLLASISAAIADGFAKFTAKPEPKKDEPPKADPAAPFDVAGFSDATGKAISAGIAAAMVSIDQRLAPLQALPTEFASLKAKVEGTPAGGGFSRPPANGGGDQHLTDC